MPNAVKPDSTSPTFYRDLAWYIEHGRQATLRDTRRTVVGVWITGGSALQADGAILNAELSLRCGDGSAAFFRSCALTSSIITVDGSSELSLDRSELGSCDMMKVSAQGSRVDLHETDIDLRDLSVASHAQASCSGCLGHIVNLSAAEGSSIRIGASDVRIDMLHCEAGGSIVLRDCPQEALNVLGAGGEVDLRRCEVARVALLATGNLNLRIAASRWIAVKDGGTPRVFAVNRDGSPLEINAASAAGTVSIESAEGAPSTRVSMGTCAALPAFPMAQLPPLAAAPGHWPGLGMRLSAPLVVAVALALLRRWTRGRSGGPRLATMACLGSCAVVSLLWARSVRHEDWLVRHSGGRVTEIYSAGGALRIWSARDIAIGPGAQWMYSDRERADASRATRAAALLPGSFPLPRLKTQLLEPAVIPWWCLWLVTAWLPLRAGAGSCREVLRRCRGRCACCGYDLRASLDRCPECGMASSLTRRELPRVTYSIPPPPSAPPSPQTASPLPSC
jgi:hypothetical protein